MTEAPNVDLVSKQRTQSIDMSMELGAPRTFSVDSVDYTTMLTGDVEEPVKEEVRRRHRNRKPRKLLGWRARMSEGTSPKRFIIVM